MSTPEERAWQLEQDNAELRGQLERLHDQKLAADLQHADVQRELESTIYRMRQALTSLRWWAVASLVWMVREAAEPAINAWNYPASWAFQLTHMSSIHWPLVAAFAGAAVLIAPLPVFLATVPASAAARRMEGFAVVGLAVAFLGYVLLYTLALRVDVPHVRANYLWAAGLMGVHALLLACWHNARLVREADEQTGEHACGDSAI